MREKKWTKTKVNLLKKLYTEECQPVTHIAKLFSVAPGTIKTMVSKLGIKRSGIPGFSKSSNRKTKKFAVNTSMKHQGLGYLKYQQEKIDQISKSSGVKSLKDMSPEKQAEMKALYGVVS